MKDEAIRPIAQEIYEYRSRRNEISTAENDWELAKEYIRGWAFLPIKTYCEMVFENKLTHRTRPLIQGGY